MFLYSETRAISSSSTAKVNVELHALRRKVLVERHHREPADHNATARGSRDAALRLCVDLIARDALPCLAPYHLAHFSLRHAP